MSRPFTADEVREMFLGDIRAAVDYWSRPDSGKSLKEAMDGLAFSILMILDNSNTSGDCPVIRIATEEDPVLTAELQEDGQNWPADGTVINDVELHALWYKR